MPLILASVALATGFAAFLVFAGLPDGHSARFNYAWLIGYTEAFQAGAVLPRFLPTLNGGMGGFDFFFYGPLPFWLTSVIAVPLCPGCAPETPFIAIMAALSILGSIGVYLLCRRFFNPVPSFAGAALYTILPYHLWVDWFVRQAATEYAAYAFLPFIALGMDRLRTQQHGGGLIVFGVTGTVLCHLPTALLAAHVFGLMTLAVIFHPTTPVERRLSLLCHYVGWTIFGVLLTAFYWLPAVALLSEVSPDALYETHYAAQNWLFGPKNDWLLGSTNAALDSLAVLYNFIAFALAVIICGLAAIVTKGLARALILVPIVFAVFMNTSLSAFLWEHWIIALVQFPWRFLVFADLATALGIAGIVSGVTQRRLHAISIIPLVAVFAATSSLIYQSFAAGDLPGQTDTYYKGYAPSEYLSPERYEATQDARDEILAGVDIDTINDIAFRRIAAAHALARAGTYTDYTAQGRVIRLRPAPNAERVLAPVQYWFLWQAETEDGDPLTLTANPDFGTVDVLVPLAGFDGSLITLRLQYHWSERIGTLMSALTLALLAGLVAIRRLARNRSAIRT